MKKNLLFIAACVTQQVLYAQVEVSTKSFELESINKHKGWGIIDAGRDPVSNNIYIKFAQSICDETKSIWTGTRTYRGLEWNIDKVLFDQQFNLQGNELIKYRSSEEAILNNEYVFGKTYMPMPVNLGKSFTQGGASLPRGINNSFLFKQVVSGTAGITGFKINVSAIGCQPVVRDTKTQGTLCGETTVVENLGSTDAKEEKGQRWIPIYNNPVPDGGNILFSTVGVNPDPNKGHFVFRKYDKNAAVEKELALSFDYQCILSVKELELSPGTFDYIIMVHPLLYKKSKQPTTQPLNYEYIRVNGATFEVKERIAFTSVYTRWMVEYAVEQDGALYLAGQCTASKENYNSFDMWDIKDYDGFQVMKIAGGKVAYVTGVNEAAAQAVLKTVPGTKGKPVISFVFKHPLVHNNPNAFTIETKVVNGVLFVSAQNLSGYGSKGPERGAMVTMVFGQTGALQAYLVKPEETFAKSNIFFSADGNTLFWAIQDLDSYNTIFDAGNGGLLPKKFKQTTAALGVVKYDVAKNELGNWQDLKNEEWGVVYEQPVLFDSPSEIVFLGRKLTKKAKESEVVFIQLKK